MKTRVVLSLCLVLGTATVACGQANHNDIEAAQAVSVPSGVLFFDGFDYPVARDDKNKFSPNGPFVAHGWSGGKDGAVRGPHVGGWLYTATSIPGFTGTFPGVTSTHVLVVECRAGTEAKVIEGAWRQTSFHLQYGDPERGSTDTIPPDVWLQHWIYICDAGDQRSLFPPTQRLGKWFYPTRNGYPSKDLEWLFSLSGVIADSDKVVAGSSREVDIGFKSLAVKLDLTDTDNNIFNDGRPDGRNKLGYTGKDPKRLTAMTPNQWWLMRVHIDHTVRPGIVEVWIRPRDGDWVKVIDTTTSPSVLWTPKSSEGHRALCFPTTMSNWHQNPAQQTTHGDWWIFIDDFAIARGKQSGGNGIEDLPSYP